MSWRRTKAIARKEFLHIVRDARSLIMALAIPFLMLLLFGWALSLDVDEIPTLVYDADGSPRSRELVSQFEGSRFFRVLGRAGNVREIEERIDRSEALLGVVLPHDFSERLLRSETAEVQLILDGSDSNTASIAAGYADALLGTYEGKLAAAFADRRGIAVPPAPVEPRLRIWYNSELESKNYIVPGLIAVILMIIAALLTSLTIAREWEMGTMEQLLSTPVRPAELVLGKMAAFFVVGLLDAATATAVGVFLFRVPFRGDLLLLLVTTCVYIFGTLCWGLLLSAITRAQLLAFQMGIVSSFLPAFLLSGFVFAIENMPLPIRVFTHIVPARYFVTILKGVYLKGVGLGVLWIEVLFLLAFGLIVFVAATRKVGRKLG